MFWVFFFSFVFLNWRRKFRVSLNNNIKIHRHQTECAITKTKKKGGKKMFHWSLQTVDSAVFVLGYRVPAAFRPCGRNRPPSCASKSVEQVAKSVLRLCCRTQQQRQHQIIMYVRICLSSLSWQFARITFFLFYVGFRQPQISAYSITITGWIAWCACVKTCTNMSSFSDMTWGTQSHCSEGFFVKVSLPGFISVE